MKGIAGAGFTLLMLSCAPALAGDAPYSGVTGLPYFGAEPWGGWRNADKSRWEGGYVRASTGFSVTSVRKGPTVGGPTLGIETGKMWRDGQWVYGLGAGFEAMPTAARFSGANRFGAFSRDFDGGAHFKAGYLVHPDVLVYGRVGASTFVQSWKAPPGMGGRTETISGVAVDARAGAQWAVTDNLSVTVEVGVRQYR